MIIIGITGKAGAGKGEAVKYLKTMGFVHFSARAFLMKEISKRNLPTTRDSARTVADDLRKKFLPSYIIEQLYEEAAKSQKNCVIESLRAVAEVEFLRKSPDFFLLGIVASQKIRYEHIQNRNSEFDRISFEEFVRQDRKEWSSKNPAEMSIDECLRMADYTIKNEGTREELGEKIGVMLSRISLPARN